MGAILTEQSLVEEIVPSTRPKLEIVEATEDYGKVIVEPLERGFGVTLGNALRRVLLSSLPGAAITWVRIDGVQHEYSTIPHVKEDVSELFMNIKGVRIKPMADRPGSLRLEVQGPGLVTAGDIQPSADFEIVNPEQYLASLDSHEGRMSMEFQVEIGKGYVAATHTEGMQIGVLPVDAIFTPVTKVNFNVEKTRVGQVTNYDRLVLEVWTDKTKSPVDAVKEAGQLLVDSFFQFVTLGQTLEGSQERPSLSQNIPADQYNMPIERLNLSARTLNCLKRSKINKVGEVLEKSHDELLKIKNFGEKSLQELYDRLRSMGFMPMEDATAPKVGEDQMGGDEAPTNIAAGRGAIKDLSALKDLLAQGDQSAGNAKVMD